MLYKILTKLKVAFFKGIFWSIEIFYLHNFNLW